MDVGTAVGIAVIAAVIGLAIGFVFGKGRGGKPGSSPNYPDLRIGLSDLAKSLKTGRVATKGGGKEVEEVRRAIAEWAPKGTGEGIAFRTALRRMHSFLEAKIDAPLEQGLKSRGSLGATVREARAAIQDLELFLVDPSGDSKREELTDLVRGAVSDFTNEWDVSLRFGPPSRPIHVMAGAEAFQDALYLILHNAVQFGASSPVSVEISEKDGWGRVVVTDGGAGFTTEALSRAYDPFYSTKEGGLGLGLSHARQVVQDQGGRIHLRNARSGGAQVEISLPVAS